MKNHKAWDWTKTDNSIWFQPSEDSYYLLNRWKNKSFSSILDLGCGLGRHSYFFAENGFNVSAIDLSEEAIAIVNRNSNEKNLKIESFVSDMINLPFEENSFDCLIAYHVISHTTSEGIEKIISEMKRVLKPDGEFFITLCSKNAWSFKDAGFPVHDENTVIRIEDGPENGIPHFYADNEIILNLFDKENLIFVKHTQDQIVNGKDYGSWHYFILGKN